jgi:hypothetical protein
VSVVLRIAALVLFIVAAIFVWATNRSVGDAVGFVAAGLGCWVASTLPLPPGPA